MHASSTHYPLQATIHYHSSAHDGVSTPQPVVFFSRAASPLAPSSSGVEFRYALYRSEDCAYEDLVPFRRSPPWIRPHLGVSSDETAEQVEIAPGEHRSFDLSLKLDYWLHKVEAGKKYWLRYIGAEDAIKVWRYGPASVSHYLRFSH